MAPGHFIANASDQASIGGTGDFRNSNSLVISKGGTSMAAPVISGSIALLQQVANEYIGRNLNVSEIRKLIKQTSTNVFDGNSSVVTPTRANYDLIDIHEMAKAILELAIDFKYWSAQIGCLSSMP